MIDFGPGYEQLGQFGFSYVVPPAGSVVPPPSTRMLYTGPGAPIRAWTVTLASMQFGANPPTVIQSFPDTNNTKLIPDKSVDLNPGWAALVTWGSGGATETALVDWYAQGCSFTVWGEAVTVDAVARFAQGPGSFQNRQPTLSAFMVPGRRSSTRQPTCTTRVAMPVQAGVTQVVPIPNRAVQYRFLCPNSLAANTLFMQQVRTDQTNLEYEVVQPQATESNPSVDGLPSNRGAYYQLHPEAQLILITGPTAGPGLCYLQFVLDLG